VSRLAYSRREVAEMLGISVRTVERRIADGTLREIRIGGASRVLASSVQTVLGAEAPAQKSDRDAERWARELLAGVR
jgi:excisionase family DNA binding protein